MKPARLAVLAVALGAAGVAAMLMNQSSPPPAPVQTEVKVPSSSTEVLVASADLQAGQKLRPGDIRWQPWPKDLVPAGIVLRSTDSGALEELDGAIVRATFAAGEPIRRERLVKANAGFLSAILPSGMRAVAISIDTRGSSTAGGFILPNDRVDVLRTGRDEDAAKGGGMADAQVSETILRNVKVLAIGQNVQERGGEKVVTGDTATLEVTPGQAEMLAVAQKTGQISLALRPLLDATGSTVQTDVRPENSLTIIRAGVAQTTKR